MTLFLHEMECVQGGQPRAGCEAGARLGLPFIIGQRHVVVGQKLCIQRGRLLGYRRECRCMVHEVDIFHVMRGLFGGGRDSHAQSGHSSPFTITAPA